jgi:uncharacterized membrane protein required for colicin V production
MTTFDWIVLAVIGLSTLFAFFRGVVRELIAVIAWLLGLVAAIAFAPAICCPKSRVIPRFATSSRLHSSSSAR